MTKKIAAFLILTFILTSCGRDGPLTFPGEQKRPDFDDVIWSD